MATPAPVASAAGAVVAKVAPSKYKGLGALVAALCVCAQLQFQGSHNFAPPLFCISIINHIWAMWEVFEYIYIFTCI
jgi:hypothetical protein